MMKKKPEKKRKIRNETNNIEIGTTQSARATYHIDWASFIWLNYVRFWIFASLISIENIFVSTHRRARQYASTVQM